MKYSLRPDDVPATASRSRVPVTRVASAQGEGEDGRPGRQDHGEDEDGGHDAAAPLRARTEGTCHAATLAPGRGRHEAPGWRTSDPGATVCPVTTGSEVGLLRLVAQRVAGPRAATPAEAVRRLTAVQGQDHPGSVLSVALRTAGRSRAEVFAAMDRGEIVRSWPMRGTLHLTLAEDLPWMLDLLGQRALAGVAKRRALLELTEEDVARACEVAVAALSGGRRLSRAGLLAAFDAGGVPVTGQRGYHLIWFAAQTGHICLGPTEDGEQQFVLLDEWVPGPRRPEREEALGELAARFFAGHGPGTVQDLARWSGLTVRDCRAGLAPAREHLDSTTVEGVEHFLDPATPELLAACREEARGTVLLPGFDEFVLGYGDRSAVLDPAYADRIAPGANGIFQPTVVVAGRVVGTWHYAGRGARRAAVGTAFDPADADLVTGVPELAAALP